MKDSAAGRPTSTLSQRKGSRMKLKELAVTLSWSVLLLMIAVPAVGQGHKIDLDEACVALEPHGDEDKKEAAAAGSEAAPVEPDPASEPKPSRQHALVTATVSPELAGGSVRLYFRRMDIEVEDFYWSPMNAEGDSKYWGVLPDPEDHPPVVKEYDDAESAETSWAEWWKAKDQSTDRDPNGDLDTELIKERASTVVPGDRDWMEAMSNEDLQEFLESLENEPTEYYAALFDSKGKEVGRSDMRVGPVQDTCENPALTPQQVGESYNQTIGETAAWQTGKSVYHWECDHLVSRIDPLGVKMADGLCRACAIVWWEGGWVPFVIAGAGGVLISSDPPPEVSPSAP